MLEADNSSPNPPFSQGSLFLLYPDTSFCIMKCNEIDVRVRYQETDQMGIVYYSNYFVYFEMGRIEFLRNHGISYAEIEKENIFLAVAEAHCKYRAPAMFDDLLVIKTCLSKMKHARIEFCYEIRRNNEEKTDCRRFHPPCMSGYKQKTNSHTGKGQKRSHVMKYDNFTFSCRLCLQKNNPCP